MSLHLLKCSELGSKAGTGLPLPFLTNINTQTHIQILTHMHTHALTHAHTHTCSHIHAHTIHTHTHTPWSLPGIYIGLGLMGASITGPSMCLGF